MKSTHHSLITLAMLVVGGIIGATALSAMAETANWTAPDCTPPDCNAEAPLNVGEVTQTKTGALVLGGLGVVSSNFFFNPGSVTEGSVLTALNGDGLIGWRQLPVSEGGSCSNDPIDLTNGTTYQNLTDHKLAVIGNVSTGPSPAASASIRGYIGASTPSSLVASDGESDRSGEGDYSAKVHISFIVPVGYFYRVSSTASGANPIVETVQAWELCP